MYDIVIIGGGPAGSAAAVYAARKQMKGVLITEFFGGQSVVSDDIQNWIGEKSISGIELAKKLENHVRSFEIIEIVTGDKINGISKIDKGFLVVSEGGKKFETKTVLMTLGAHRKKLGILGEDKFNGKGVAYCATCDAPLFTGKEVVVVGGGNAGLESVVDLIPYAYKIYLIVRSDSLKGDKIMQEAVLSNKKVTVIYTADSKEIKGNGFVEKFIYIDKKDNQEKELSVQGVFVEIGSVPSSGLVKDLVDLNERGEIIVDHKTQRSSLTGIWVAGDVGDGLYKQNNISAGDAVKAVLNIDQYLNKGKGV